RGAGKPGRLPRAGPAAARGDGDHHRRLVRTARVHSIPAPAAGPAKGAGRIAWLIASTLIAPSPYCAKCSCEMLVPIESKVVTISFAEVSRKNLFESVAHCFSSVEVGSPPVLTWTV